MRDSWNEHVRYTGQRSWNIFYFSFKKFTILVLVYQGMACIIFKMESLPASLLEILFFSVFVDCLKSLGVSTRYRIPDADMTASSQFDSHHAPSGGRLNAQDQLNSQGTVTQIGGWAALTRDQNQWLQIKFGQIFQISGVATQGRSDSTQWVTSYKLEYSSDGSSWTYYPDVRCAFNLCLRRLYSLAYFCIFSESNDHNFEKYVNQSVHKLQYETKIVDTLFSRGSFHGIFITIF